VVQEISGTGGKAWYRVMLGVEPSLEHAPTGESATRSGSGPPKPTRMCFFRLHIEHPYQDVVAIFEMPGTRDDSGMGLVLTALLPSTRWAARDSR